MKSVCIFVCLLVSIGAHSQRDTSSVFIQPSIYFDYGKLATISSNFERKIEGGIEIIIAEKLQLTSEIGTTRFTPQSAFENGDYQSEGAYIRLGVGIVPVRSVKGRIGVGIRYGLSAFDDQGTYFIQSPSEFQPDIEASYARKNLSGSWWEFAVFSDQKLNRWLSAGFTMRMRFLLSYDQQSVDEVDVYAIPGYGRTIDKSIPAVNLFIRITPI